MADMIHSASRWLATVRAEHASREVSYQRGEHTIDALTATVGHTVFRTQTAYGFERTEARDYLIATADLVLDGQVSLPERGDQIRETDGEQTFIYEVMAPAREPCWKYSDRNRETLRIHTKLVGTA